jgi:hypothetical protein
VTSASEISIESLAGSKLFGSADSSRFEFGEMLAIKKFTWSNAVTLALRDVSEWSLDRRITDDHARQGSFLYI